MRTLGLQDQIKPESQENGISLGSLAELTGFPVEYIKRELVLTDNNDLSVDELRTRVMAYLNSELN